MFTPGLIMPRWFYFTLALSSVTLTACGGGTGSSLPSTPGATFNAINVANTTTTEATQSSYFSQTRSVASVTGNSAYTNAVLADTPAASYQLNDTASVLTDSGPNRIAGTYRSGVRHQTAALTNGGSSAAGFAGGSAYDANMFASAPVSPRLMPATLSVEAWIKVGQYNTTGKMLSLVSFGRYVDVPRYGLFINQQNAIVYQQVNAGLPLIQLLGGVSMLPGNVYHVVGTSDGTNVSLYVNGKLANTKPYPGAPVYNPKSPYGLYIGGSPTSANPSFNGTIAQVAVYGSALSSTQVLKHYVAGQIAPMTLETPIMSDSFVDSIGVNTHFTDYTSQYGTNYTQAKAALIGLGIRHIRDALVPAGHPKQLSQFADLGASGVHGLFVTDLSMTKSTIQGFPSQVGSMFEAYEPPNEQDDVGNPTWLADLKAFQPKLYSWVKSNPATKKYPVIGPVLVGSASYPLVGNISANMDYANIHNYMFPYNPGTAGYGSIGPYGRYGSISYIVNLVKVTSANKPVVATETGYGTDFPGDVDNHTMLRYIPRLLFEQLNAGIVRTYTYELIDQLPVATSVFQTFGLVRHDFTPKPAYNAAKAIIAALTDQGAAFTPTPLSYQIVGNTGQVMHTLMQKRNGNYVLAIWIEQPSWNISASSDIVIPNQTVTINTAKSFAGATIQTLDEDGNMSTAWIQRSNQTSETFSVSDKVNLITLIP